MRWVPALPNISAAKLSSKERKVALDSLVLSQSYMLQVTVVRSFKLQEVDGGSIARLQNGSRMIVTLSKSGVASLPAF